MLNLLLRYGNIPDLLNVTRRGIHITGSCQKNLRAGVPKITRNRNKRLNYEEALRPHTIGVRKGWNAWNTSNLFEETDRTAETTIEDMIIRKFMEGTWHNKFLSEIIIKRRLNLIVIAGFVYPGYMVQNRTHYFMKGYTEELLSHYLKRPVRVEIQTVKDRDSLNFKRI